MLTPLTSLSIGTARSRDWPSIGPWCYVTGFIWKSEGVECKAEKEMQQDPMVRLGRDARESSLDAHGELVAPDIAFDFIKTMLTFAR